MEAGANVNAANDKQWTPLHHSARYGHAEIVQVSIRYFSSSVRLLTFLQALVARGASVDVENNYGWTPLNLASYAGQLQIATVSDYVSFTL